MPTTQIAVRTGTDAFMSQAQPAPSQAGSEPHYQRRQLRTLRNPSCTSATQTSASSLRRSRRCPQVDAGSACGEVMVTTAEETRLGLDETLSMSGQSDDPVFARSRYKELLAFVHQLHSPRRQDKPPGESARSRFARTFKQLRHAGRPDYGLGSTGLLRCHAPPVRGASRHLSDWFEPIGDEQVHESVNALLTQVDLVVLYVPGGNRVPVAVRPAELLV